jgi:hypothetical protein
MFPKQRDGFLVKLLWLSLRNQWREIPLSSQLFLIVGGVFCLLWPLSDLRDFLHANAAGLRAVHFLWPASLALCLVTGAGFGLHSSARALDYAGAPYLQVLPLSRQDKRRMAAFACHTGSLLTAPLAGIALTLICLTIDKPEPALRGIGAALAYISGAALGITARTASRMQAREEIPAAEPSQLFRLPLPAALHRLDRACPAWLSNWSTGMEAERLPFSVPRLLGFLLVLAAAAVPGAAGLADHQGGPATAGAVLAGFLAFILVVRCRPLRSPVLRSAPIGFMKTWFGMLRLPLVLSAGFFIIPDCAALAAQPAAWAMSASGAIGLLVLDAAYAVFAAFFLMSPLLAAGSFFTVVLYASYKWVTYHAVVYLCFAALLALMVHGIRRRFYNGP